MDPGALGIEPPRLIPFAHLLVHMRNRAYSPQMGRFMQPDPNATALTLIEAASYHGRGMDAMVAAFSITSLYGDGLNTQQYLRSNPWQRGDPLGLLSEYGDAVEEGLHPLDEALDAFALLDPLPGPADFIREAASALIEDYAANLDWDVEWAMDWSLPDDDHSRGDNSWVTLALGRGLRDAFEIGIPGTDRSFNPADVFAGSRVGRSTGRSGGGKVRGGYTIQCARGHEAQ